MRDSTCCSATDVGRVSNAISALPQAQLKLIGPLGLGGGVPLVAGSLSSTASAPDGNDGPVAVLFMSRTAGLAVPPIVGTGPDPVVAKWPKFHGGGPTIAFALAGS